MNIFDAVKFAFRSIISTPLRIGLTALGVIVGVTSVIVLVSLGQGIRKQVEDYLPSLSLLLGPLLAADVASVLIPSAKTPSSLLIKILNGFIF